MGYELDSAEFFLHQPRGPITSNEFEATITLFCQEAVGRLWHLQEIVHNGTHHSYACSGKRVVTLVTSQMRVEQNIVGLNIRVSWPAHEHFPIDEFRREVAARASSEDWIKRTNFFLSYRRSDSRDITERIGDHLGRAFQDHQVLQDATSFTRVGTDFRVQIDDSMRRCHVVLVIIGPQWASVEAEGVRRLWRPDDVVRQEVVAALASDSHVLPVLVADAAMPRPEDLPADLHDLLHRQAAKVRRNPDFSADMALLVTAIRNLW